MDESKESTESIESVELTESKPKKSKPRKPKVKSMTRDDFLPLLMDEFKRLGIRFEIDGKLTSSKDSVWFLFSTMFDLCMSAVVAGDRLALNGIGTFWQCNSVLKFRASKRYRKLLKDFIETVNLSDSPNGRFQQFLSFMRLESAKKTESQKIVQRLADLMI